MIDTENMTFEEARLALVDDLKSSLENLRNRFADPYDGQSPAL